MDPVFTLFWGALLMELGFLFSYIVGWHWGASAAILSSFMLIGLAAGNALGYGVSLLPCTGLMVGLGWGADVWRRQRGWSMTD